MAPAKSKQKGGNRHASKPHKDKAAGVGEQEPCSTNTIALDLQQLVLNIFRHSFSARLEADVKPLLQEIKGHLYKRDFATAFGKEEYLEAYAARWSPSRALGYLQILEGLQGTLHPFDEQDNGSDAKRWKVVCLGGGAGAELVALGGLLKLVETCAEEETGKKAVDIVSIDMANWANVVEKLRTHITTEPPLSKYASAAVQAANTRLVDPARLNIEFHQHDLLNTPFPTLSPLFQDTQLVTLMFTLNELYTTSLALTQKLLINITQCLRPGSFLLVVDSPGSYSAVSLNGTEKKYPMQWLLDHTLLQEDDKGRGETQRWEKVEGDQSRWFRLEPSLRYAIELENMRYQLHLYRRVG